MRINWKRFLSGAFVLGSLSLLLYGCGDLSSPNAVQNTVNKSISGIVSDPATGLPVQNATVTAYAIDANGFESSTPLSLYPTSTTTNQRGAYKLSIPLSYNGAVVVEAVMPTSLPKMIAKLLFSSAGTTIKAAISQNTIAQPSIPPVMISYATNVLVEFVRQNSATGGFTQSSIQTAAVALETFFGPNFGQTPPPTSATDTNTSQAQQDLLVSISALNSVIANSNSTVTIANIVTALASPGGLGVLADSINSSIASSAVALQSSGALPTNYQVNTDITSAVSNAQNAGVVVVVSDTTPPSAPTTLTATTASAHRVNLTWGGSTDSGANATGVAGYTIARADASGVYVTLDTVDAGTTTYADVFAAGQTAYSYQVFAFDGARNISAASNTATATTLRAADTLLPTAPTGLACNGFNQTQVNLQWKQSSKTNADGTTGTVTGYNVYRNSALIATVPDTSYSDTGLTAGTSYTYYVRAADSDSNLSLSSGTLTISTLPAVNATPPNPPTGLTTVMSTGSSATPSVVVSWTASVATDLNPAAMTTYNVYRDGTTLATGLTGTTFNDASFIPSSHYVYKVTASGSNGESAAATSAIDTPASAVADSAPSVPVNLVAFAATANSVSLAWSPSVKTDGDKIVAGYDVLRGDGTGSNFVKIASVTTPGFTDSTVSPLTAYSYEVKSFSTGGTRSVSSLAWGTTTPAAADLTDHTAPLAPGHLIQAAQPTTAAISISWDAAVKNNADATHFVAGYRVYRNGSQVADVTSLTFTDSSMTPGVLYNYSVRAYDNSGNISDASNVLQQTAPLPPPNTYSVLGKITINGGGVAQVIVVLTDSNGNAVNSVVTDANGGYIFTGVNNGGYTVTPQASGFYRFSPESKSIVVSNSAVTGQDFTAVLSGTVTGSVTYPDGTIVGGITYPTGTVINGVYYPTATVIGGVTYPTGTVIGGVLYPDGVVIAGVSYPAGTVVGGIAFPVGAVTTGVVFPTGTVIGGTIYPTGTVSGGVILPSGTVIGSIGFPTGAVVDGVIYPSGTVAGGVIYPTGGVIGGVNYPNGTIVGGISYPNGSVVGGILYPTSTVLGGVTYPTGTVLGGILYPDGVVIGGVSYPAGTIVGGVAFPAGAVTTGLAIPSGEVIGGITYPTGTVTGGIILPSGTAMGTVTYPSGAVVSGTLYPSGTVIAGMIFSTGAVTGNVGFPQGGVSVASLTFPGNTLVGSLLFPSGSASGSTSTPGGSLTGALNWGSN